MSSAMEENVEARAVAVNSLKQLSCDGRLMETIMALLSELGKSMSLLSTTTGSAMIGGRKEAGSWCCSWYQ